MQMKSYEGTVVWITGASSGGRGHIVVASSVAGKYSPPLRSGAAKAALHGFFDSLRAETAKDGLARTDPRASHALLAER